MRAGYIRLIFRLKLSLCRPTLFSYSNYLPRSVTHPLSLQHFWLLYNSSEVKDSSFHFFGCSFEMNQLFNGRQPHPAVCFKVQTKVSLKVAHLFITRWNPVRARKPKYTGCFGCGGLCGSCLPLRDLFFSVLQSLPISLFLWGFFFVKYGNFWGCFLDFCYKHFLKIHILASCSSHLHETETETD